MYDKAVLPDLNAIVAVAEHRSFRKAAVALGMSPSALSHRISVVEQRMGVRLFNRTTRSVAPSAAGEQFLSEVRPALARIEQAIAGINALQLTPSGTIRINASEGAAQMVLAPVVLAFLARYPEMQVDLVTEGRLVDIVAEGFDLGIRLAEHLPRDMVAVQCTPPLRFVVVGAAAYFARHPAPLAPSDLHSHQCIRTRLPSGALYRWEFGRDGIAESIEPAGQLTCDDYHLMIRAAELGFGVAWVSEWSVREQLAQGTLQVVLGDWSPMLPGLSMYYPGHRHLTAGMRAFLDLVREVLPRASYPEPPASAATV